jgi:hypothetical protein
MARQYSTSEIEAFLDEALEPDQMTEIETSLRDDDQLMNQVAEVLSRRESGIHTLGEIWRKHQISCPSREDLGSYLLNVLSSDQQLYIQFHLETINCRFCQANLDDLKEQQLGNKEDQSARRKRYFESSAGYLQRDN